MSDPSGNLLPKHASIPMKLLATLLGILVAFALAEVVTRIYVPDPTFTFENRPELFLEDSFMGDSNSPNYEDYAQGFVHVRTNSLGFRGSEVLSPKPPCTFRILGIGDSITWGVGVQDDDTFLRVLEDSLNVNSSSGNGARLEVVNAGVIGYSTHQELRMMEKFGLLLQPDLAIVGLAMNDAYPTEDPFFNLQQFHKPHKENLRRRSYATSRPYRSYFLRFMRTRARILREQIWHPRQPLISGNRDSWPEDSFEGQAWPFIQLHLENMRKLAAENGFDLLVVIFPTYQQLALLAPTELPQVRIREFLIASGIKNLDLYKTMRGREKELLRDTMHLSEAGHRVVAERLHAVIDSNYYKGVDRHKCKNAS